MPVLDLIRCVFFLFTKLISVIPQTRPEKKNLINIFIVLVLVKKMVRNWKKKKKKVPRENYSPPTVISHYFEFFFSTSRSKLTRSPASLCSQFSLLQPPEPIQKKNRNNKKKGQMIQCQFLFLFRFFFYLSNWKHSAWIHVEKKENPELRLVL